MRFRRFYENEIKFRQIYFQEIFSLESSETNATKNVFQNQSKTKIGKKSHTIMYSFNLRELKSDL